jgi:DNA-binding PadR family transcriptional regulator
VISAPKGVLKLAALRMLSESSMSGKDLAEQVQRVTDGQWRPGPGSVYLILGELLRKGLISELPKRDGNIRRYIVSSKGKEELARLSKETEADVGRQLKLLAVYSSLAGKPELQRRIQSLLKSSQQQPERRGE